MREIDHDLCRRDPCETLVSRKRLAFVAVSDPGATVL